MKPESVISAAECSDRLDHLAATAQLRDQLRREPELRYLFLELTDCCNLHCLHCGSRCEEGKSQYLRIDKIRELICSVSVHEPRVHVCLTGGEPLLHPDFEEIARTLKDSGLYWSVVTNGTLISPDIAEFLADSHIYSVSVSLDGDEEEHDRLRQCPGAYQHAINGIQNLKAARIRVQVTSVITKKTLHQLDTLEENVRRLGGDSWKVINIEPIGRALDNRELLLDEDEFLSLLDFIRARQSLPGLHMKITYGCSHLLPQRYESVRLSPFLCGAGILIAGIRCNGDIAGCLDIEPRPELVQGNIYREDFWTVWKSRYTFFRIDRTRSSARCNSCELHEVCGGDSLHSWDFEKKEPRMCVADL